MRDEVKDARAAVKKYAKQVADPVTEIGFLTSLDKLKDAIGWLDRAEFHAEKKRYFPDRNPDSTQEKKA